MKDIVKTTIILSLIAIIAGVLLGSVYQLTYVDPAVLLDKKLNLAYENKNGFDEIKNIDTYKPSVSAERATLIGAYKAKDKDDVYIYYISSVGFKAGIELMIVVEANKIINIYKVATNETYPKPFEKNYTGQYYGIDLNEVESFKLVKNPANDDEIAVFSQVTRTSNAILDTINLASGYHKNLVGSAV